MHMSAFGFGYDSPRFAMNIIQMFGTLYSTTLYSGVRAGNAVNG